jgi:hypothetical protein
MPRPVRDMDMEELTEELAFLQSFPVPLRPGGRKKGGAHRDVLPTDRLGDETETRGRKRIDAIGLLDD